MNPLAVVPTYLREPGDLAVVLRCLETLKATAPDLDVLIVDDGSDVAELVDELAMASLRLQFALHRKTTNDGFSRTVNIGLTRAREEGRDAILLNSDLEFRSSGWLEALLYRDAAVVGARLLYPNGLIQHAGIFFSMLHRTFAEIYKYGPANLPEALEPRICPVTGALQLIRHECLDAVGLYDEKFRMGYEDVDYCIRAFQSGRVCVYEPRCVVMHHESLFRGRPSPKIAEWQRDSWIYFTRKYATTSFSEWIPNLVDDRVA